ncbi:uncharacterized protein LOC114541753 [Dendronephthya gigantea]|uniref:uncharacterized protein LOC114541753 n=1 Tax=Dendronephthya gigantea TaxID=151771 RepID=UPI00106C0C32|nr:uncharacterized protein LOC114541750 isoform X1 [Dendronephthya gigantea]XP_028417359.1 uncharacterized protein LOC114541753 [Dendronephthya gigantea]
MLRSRRSRYSDVGPRKSCKNIIIKSPDTDVLVIALNACLEIDANIYFETGVGSARRIISLSNVRESLGHEWCSSLIGLHAFTGCDTTSAFYGKGKVSVLKVAKAREEYSHTFSNLGTELNPSEDLFTQLYHFVCHLYGYQGYSDINRVRYEMFKSGKFDEELLPPNKDSLDQHINRANYQCFIWRKSTQAILNLPSFFNHGWKLDAEGNVYVNWMILPAAPDSILEFVSCKCKKGCENRRCSCVKASLRCSDLCSCTECRNKSTNGDDVESDSDDCYDDGSSSENDEN